MLACRQVVYVPHSRLALYRCSYLLGIMSFLSQMLKIVLHLKIWNVSYSFDKLASKCTRHSSSAVCVLGCGANQGWTAAIREGDSEAWPTSKTSSRHHRSWRSGQRMHPRPIPNYSAHKGEGYSHMEPIDAARLHALPSCFKLQSTKLQLNC